MDTGSVTGWLVGLRRGDSVDARRVWERYYHRLAGQARRVLQRKRLPTRGFDEEDVAAATFASLFQGAARGRFVRLDDRDDLWQVLSMIMARQAATLAEREGRRKRGGGRVVLEADWPGGGAARALAAGPGDGLDQLAGRGSAPESAVQSFEGYRRLLDLLGDETLRKIALWKLDGYTHEEIRRLLGCSLRSVANKVELIRRTWTEAEDGP